MTQEDWKRIAEVQDMALQDEEYMALYKEYVPARDAFGQLWNSLPPEQRRVVDAYISGSASLFHRLMALACRKGD